MKSKKSKPNAFESDFEDIPLWVTDEAPSRATPYTEEELDRLVDGTLESIRDTESWKNLVLRVGEEEARQVLRSRIIMRDENAGKLPRH